jgi:hypothetical protein
VKYVVKMRMTIIKEYDVEIDDTIVDNVVDAMDIADAVMNDGIPSSDCCLTIRETPWAPVSVIEREEENE